MSNFETLHGDEESIEICSGRFYELLDPHFSLETGALDLEGPAEQIEELWDALFGEGYDCADINSALRDAVQTLNDKREQLSYM